MIFFQTILRNDSSIFPEIYFRYPLASLGRRHPRKGGTSPEGGTTPLPRRRHPHWEAYPSEGGDPPREGGTPSREGGTPSRIRSRSGRYAFYLNEFLFADALYKLKFNCRFIRRHSGLGPLQSPFRLQVMTPPPCPAELTENTLPSRMA